ncbi:MAG: hypothetical protein IAE79_18285 [Anaerolinea sp.]|nr:hypothetical protein [Anaerolinea sp.]
MVCLIGERPYPDMYLLIPYTRFALKTYLSAPEAEQRLAQRVRPRRWRQLRFFWSKPDPAYPFEGSVENGRFNINRIINYRNSFLPIIVGQFHEDLGFTRIEISMRMHYAVQAFLVVWVLGFLSIFWPISLGDESVGWLGGLVMFAGFVLLFLLIIVVSFNYEANKARRLLEELWTAD